MKVRDRQHSCTHHLTPQATVLCRSQERRDRMLGGSLSWQPNHQVQLQGFNRRPCRRSSTRVARGGIPRLNDPADQLLRFGSCRKLRAIIIMAQIFEDNDPESPPGEYCTPQLSTLPEMVATSVFWRLYEWILVNPSSASEARFRF